MTNWMTAAGLAFIAGGLATLISFRAVLFGSGDEDEPQPRRVPPPRPRRLTSATPRRVAGLASIGLVGEGDPGALPVRRGERSWPGEPSQHGERSQYGEPPQPRREQPSQRRPRREEQFDEQREEQSWHREDLPDEVFDGERDYDYQEEPELSRFIDNTAWRSEREPDQDDWILTGNDEVYDGPPPRPAPIDRSDRGYGDRIDGWVRPRYPELDDRPPSGDYWTPVPDDLYVDPEPSARGYGWPVPVERLPSVPDYEPVTGFDLTPVQAAEPTTLVPDWPPAPDHRIRLPRSWAARDEQGRSDDRTGNRIDREESPRGPRPRPRPRPAAIESDSAYISRHAAGPHR
ncbi:hypothetical protein [Actinoplanes sp. HUAS TT8]|uniref:hypothetical protein n=1 Tax=Actinoplanes sp. HUAS TT8 TaxID=3447453 RepID=UPI003F5277A6